MDWPFSSPSSFSFYFVWFDFFLCVCVFLGLPLWFCLSPSSASRTFLPAEFIFINIEGEQRANIDAAVMYIVLVSALIYLHLRRPVSPVDSSPFPPPPTPSSALRFPSLSNQSALNLNESNWTHFRLTRPLSFPPFHEIDSSWISEANC